jgi:hypothetical protein
MRRSTMLFAVGVCLAGAALGQAQETKMSPPKVLTITREVVKPGKAVEHTNWEAGWPRAFSKANWPVNYVALSSLTGETRALFLTGYDSLEAWEKDGLAQQKDTELTTEEDRLNTKDGDYLSGSSQAVAVYKPELSYHPEVPVAGTRYFMITSVHVKTGHGDHFTDVRKLVKAAHEKANLPDHYALYQVVMGAPGGTYLIIAPMKSAAELDQFENIHGQAYKDALGDEGRKQMAEFSSQGLEGTESQLFIFSPKMSYVSKDWIAADSDFWAPKAVVSASAKPAKKEPKKK